MKRERITIDMMISLYCSHHKEGHELCSECRQLRDYAWERLRTCPFQSGKTTCAKCPVHCYKPEKRKQIREVMRFAGPRMFCRHPVPALFHIIDGLRQKPVCIKR